MPLPLRLMPLLPRLMPLLLRLLMPPLPRLTLLLRPTPLLLRLLMPRLLRLKRRSNLQGVQTPIQFAVESKSRRCADGFFVYPGQPGLL